MESQLKILHVKSPGCCRIICTFVTEVISLVASAVYMPESAVIQLIVISDSSGHL